MPNRAIHQFPNTANRLDEDDLIYTVRNGLDYRMPAYLLPPTIYTAQAVIAAADVLTLFSSPVAIIPAPAAGKYIWPRLALIEFSGGSADYATNTQLGIGTNNGDPVLIGDISDRTAPNTAYAQVNGILNPGQPLLAYVLGGNPTAGNSDLTITMWYSILNL